MKPITPAADTKRIKKSPSTIKIYWEAIVSFNDFWDHVGGILAIIVILGAAVIALVGFQYLGYWIVGAAGTAWAEPYLVVPLAALIPVAIVISIVRNIYNRAQEIRKKHNES